MATTQQHFTVSCKYKAGCGSVEQILKTLALGCKSVKITLVSICKREILANYSIIFAFSLAHHCNGSIASIHLSPHQ